jgi:phage terminase small subunit
VPALSNPRHELFAQVLAAGCNATEAYVKAGYHLNKGNAGRLKANERIRKRVEELQARNVQAQEAAVGVTIEQLRAQFAEAYAIAKELSQPTAMVAATTAQAKLAGLWIERSEHLRKQPTKCPIPRSLLF